MTVWMGFHHSRGVWAKEVETENGPRIAGSNVAGPSPRRITTVPPVEDCARDFRAYRKAVLEFLGITE
jgi:hypothetical protein